MSTLWTSHYAGRARSLRSSDIRELLHLTQRPEMISFAGALPAPELFPVAAFNRAAQRVFDNCPTHALQYGMTEGSLSLREFLASHMRTYGIEAGPANILVTSGSQQALDLIGKLFLDAGDTVLVECPTYLGALQAWRAYEARFVALPTDADGLQVENLEAAIAEHAPKFLYLMPNFQNPTGWSLSELRRQRIIEIAAHYHVPIIEDDPYGQLRFEGAPSTPLYVLDRDRVPPPGDGRSAHVLYIGSFSKLLAPGLRLGWMVGPEPVIARLVQAKQGVDLHTGSLAQALAHEICKDGFLEAHIETLRRSYRERRDAMLAALAAAMPPEVRWTRPDGGLFLWLQLPEGLDAGALLRAALDHHVAFVPGASFHANGGGANTLRLSFSHCGPERIQVGIARLSQVVEEALAAAPRAA
jgi:2-aminoadipate transaminase